jgi:hypothetical protein
VNPEYDTCDECGSVSELDHYHTCYWCNERYERRRRADQDGLRYEEVRRLSEESLW